MNGADARVSDCIQGADHILLPRSNRVPIELLNAPEEEYEMLKTLTAALVAAGLAIAPIATAQASQPATKTVTITKTVTMNGHNRHPARHHMRFNAVKLRTH